jgi:hypothetical protein
LKHSNDPYIHLRIDRNASIAALVSLLLHILVLFLLSRYDILNQGEPASAERQTMVVRFAPKSVPRVIEPPPAEVVKPATPAPSKPRKTPPAKPAATPRVIASAKPEDTTVPLPAPTPRPEQPAPKPGALDPAKFADMKSYLDAVREQRRLAGGDADRANEEARGPTEDEVRMANLRKNLQPPGTSGVFQLLSMDRRSAQFAFRGWQNEFSHSHREVYAVEAGPDGDVARAVVRKMIEIIRRYYSEDFNWDSPRFARVVVLSARPQDNDGLEDFLMQEFFGARGVAPR